MRQQLEARLDELRVQAQRGQDRLAQLESDAAQLRQTLLRIAGAIQVLEEELAKSADAVAAEPPP
jgi:hypothetical protein